MRESYETDLSSEGSEEELSLSINQQLEEEKDE
jgi:hypothetical protein